MAVSEHGEAAGSVSGGCVESAVYEMAREALETGEPAGETFAAGLPCGGSLEIAVHAVGVEQFARSALADAGTGWPTTRRLTDGTRDFVESFAAPRACWSSVRSTSRER